jgi:ATP adenylyltransferase
MDHLFTPWRFRYVRSLKKADSECVFCRIRDASPEDDGKLLVLLRTDRCFVVLNKYPYTSGHLMVVPNDHVARLGPAGLPVLEEMIRLAARCEEAVGGAYQPQGYNLGMNVGRAGGAGIEGHLHLHLVPRWAGDTNFMTVTGDARLLPHSLEETYRALKPHFEVGEGRE